MKSIELEKKSIDAIDEFLNKGDKIEAIKLLRQLTYSSHPDLTLKMAIHTIEYRAGIRFEKPDYYISLSSEFSFVSITVKCASGIVTMDHNGRVMIPKGEISIEDLNNLSELWRVIRMRTIEP